MDASNFFGRNWRTFVVAVLGAVLAFGGSFLVEPTYQSSTRLLIHGRDATFLSSSGQDLTQQPGILDSNLATTLAQTYGGIASSRTIATAVVDDLNLDAPSADSGGPIAWVSHGLAWMYRCGRAFVTAGFCGSVDPREKAIADVQGGITALQLGSTAGESAGQPGSFILEVVASGSTPSEARDVTNAVADELVKESQARAQSAMTARVGSVEQQVAASDTEVAQQSESIAEFKTENGITDADEQQVLSATRYEQMSTDLRTAKANAADTAAQLSSIDNSLGSVSPGQTTSQRIETGRSGTEISTDGVNPVYTDLQTQRDTLRSQLSGLQARIGTLQDQLDGNVPTALNAAQSKLAVLQQSLDLAKDNQADLTQQLQEARSNVAGTGTELTRIDEAAAPTYPVSPKRYLYLALGLLIGALAGGALTWLALRHGDPDREDTIDGDDSDGPGGTRDQDESNGVDRASRNGKPTPRRDDEPSRERQPEPILRHEASAPKTAARGPGATDAWEGGAPA